MIGIHIVPPSVEFITPKHFPNWAEGWLNLIEECGRNCYQSEPKKGDTAAKFIKRHRIHESILEHGVFTVNFTGSRSMSHQLVRHRLAAYCVAGDTEVVSYRRPRHPAKRWTVETLFNWQSDPKRKGRLKLIRLRSVDPEGRIVPGRIKRIIDTGKQDLFQIKTRCGRVLCATGKERFFTSKGWMRLDDLQAGDRVYVNGLPAYANEEWLRQKYLVENLTRQEVAALAGISDSYLGVHLRRLGLQKPKAQYPGRRPGHGVPGMHGEEGRRNIAERMTGEGNPRWKGDAVGANGGHLRAQKLFRLGVCDCCPADAVERHHLNEDPTNNAPDNVVCLCTKCHKAHHAGQAVTTILSSPIESMIAVGMAKTYDIEMESAPHNFVANGFVVHNSQESQRFCDYASDRLREAVDDTPDETEEGKTKLLKVILPPSIVQTGDSIPSALAFLKVYRAGKTPLVASDQQLHEWARDKFGWSNDQAHALERWCGGRIDDYEEYLAWREQGVPSEDARSCLPNATKTSVMTTYNFRVWRHVLGHPVFGRALNDHAQWEIKGIMLAVLEYFEEHVPALFEDLRR